MSVPPRTPRPSAMDGYRRIVPAPGSDAAPVAEVHDRPRVRASRRLAGVGRIIGLLAVIAVIAGTSFGLATADPKGHPAVKTAEATPSSALQGPPAPAHVQVRHVVKPHHVVAKQHHVAVPHSSKPVARAKPTSKPIVHRAVAAARPAARAHTVRTAPAPAELPFTGMPDVTLLRVLLAGGLLTLLGMLTQIAGTPLPAYAIERKRLASLAR